MFKTTIRLSSTDATGVLYFAEQFRLCLEAFEALLAKKKFPLQELIAKSPFLMPIVHTEGDYLAPLQVGDEIEIRLSVGEIGSSSFAIDYQLFKKKKVVGRVKIVHVVVSKKTKKSVPIPARLRTLLQAL